LIIRIATGCVTDAVADARLVVVQIRPARPAMMLTVLVLVLAHVFDRPTGLLTGPPSAHRTGETADDRADRSRERADSCTCQCAADAAHALACLLGRARMLIACIIPRISVICHVTSSIMKLQ